jgi:hypothetical protein
MDSTQTLRRLQALRAADKQTRQELGRWLIRSGWRCGTQPVWLRSESLTPKQASALLEHAGGAELEASVGVNGARVWNRPREGWVLQDAFSERYDYRPFDLDGAIADTEEWLGDGCYNLVDIDGEHVTIESAEVRGSVVRCGVDDDCRPCEIEITEVVADVQGDDDPGDYGFVCCSDVDGDHGGHEWDSDTDDRVCTQCGLERWVTPGQEYADYGIRIVATIHYRRSSR